MTQKEFEKLTEREKWKVGKTFSGVLWCCKKCGSIVDDGAFPNQLPGFPGMSMYCGECDYELTRRTGGGQNDPFNFTFILK